MDIFNGCSLNLIKEMNRLRKEMNRLLRKGMSNIHLTSYNVTKLQVTKLQVTMTRQLTSYYQEN